MGRINKAHLRLYTFPPEKAAGTEPAAWVLFGAVGFGVVAEFFSCFLGNDTGLNQLDSIFFDCFIQFGEVGVIQLKVMKLLSE